MAKVQSFFNWVLLGLMCIGLVATADATTPAGMPKLSEEISGIGVLLVNEVLAVVAGLLNSAIATVFPYWQMIALVAVLGLGWWLWPAKTDADPTEEATRWTEARLRRDHIDLDA